MIERIPFESLGRMDAGWLNARYHFSFANYVDPARRGLGALLVWNDDAIEPGTGFDMHGHRDMEIVTYVREGAITHRDHLGNEGRTEAGDVQVMSAGKGIMHAEYNHEDALTRLFQIWILPDEQGVAPRWEQRRFPKDARAGELVVLASGRAGDDGALKIHQDAAVLGATLHAGNSVAHDLAEGRGAYLVPATGAIAVNGERLSARDGLKATGAERLEIEALEDSEIVLVDVPLRPASV